nr:DHH family phosphoesterase [Prevotella sp.]
MDINLLTDNEAAQLKELIAASTRIVICAHKSPDGDALGSTLGWASYLRTLGKNPRVIVPDAYPDFLRWMPDTDKILRYDKHPEEVEECFKNAELVFCLDFNQAGRLENMQQCLIESPAKKIMIDHHLNPDEGMVMTISHPNMSSTSELIFRLVWQLGSFEEINRQWCVQIYCGMMTDTGGFTYNSNDPAIYFIISQLLTKNINKDKIYRNVFNNYSSWAIRLRGYLMSQKLNYIEQYNASYFAVTCEDMENYHYIKGDLEGLVNEPLRIKGMKMSISLREDTEQKNIVLVSLRSVGTFPCNKVAEEFFNGGGHLNASGGKLHCSIIEAEKIARNAIKAYSDLLK